MRLELSRKAQADLDDIRDYSVEAFGIDRAIGYLDEIDKTFRQIVTFPELGALHATLRTGIRSLSCQQHRIFYAIDVDAVRVVRILHKAMDVERWF